MNSLQHTYALHALAFWLVLAAVVAVIAVWMLLLQLRMRRTERYLEGVFGEVSGDNMARVLAEYLTTVRQTANAVERMRVEHERIAAVMPSVIRHVGLVRFSPFHDTGGDQSFTLALLDEQRNGVVVTALHSRTDSRLYAKPVEGGQSAYALIPEEREAMEQAVRGPAAQISR